MEIKINTDPEYMVISGELESLGERLPRKGCKILIITDENVAPLYLDRVKAGLGEYQVYDMILPAGEESKNLENYKWLLEYLIDNHFTSADMLVALGGGMIGDFTGFVAATYLRGIEFIQVPTTLLAAVDSSVGGKTAVNLGKGKNMVGAFWQPSLVLFDKSVINSLSRHTYLDGLAEVIKYGVIYDKDIFDNATSNDVTMLVEKSVKAKRYYVEADVRDKGLRRFLNFGHTIGHGIERASNFEISHGHAVAMGMNLCAKSAKILGMSEDDCYTPIHNLLAELGYELKEDFDPEVIYDAATYDKKRSGDSISVVIPEKIGQCVLKKMNMDELKEFIEAGLR